MDSVFGELEYEPASRQRSLAVAQALASYPSFPSSKTAMENILNYKAFVTQFEELSGQTYPEELKPASAQKVVFESIYN